MSGDGVVPQMSVQNDGGKEMSSAAVNVVCLLCKTDLRDVSAYAHIATSHFNYRPFACDECDFRAFDRQLIEEHQVFAGHLSGTEDRDEYVETRLRTLWHDCLFAAKHGKKALVEAIKDEKSFSALNKPVQQKEKEDWKEQMNVPTSTSNTPATSERTQQNGQSSSAKQSDQQLHSSDKDEEDVVVIEATMGSKQPQQHTPKLGQFALARSLNESRSRSRLPLQQSMRTSTSMRSDPRYSLQKRQQRRNRSATPRSTTPSPSGRRGSVQGSYSRPPSRSTSTEQYAASSSRTRSPSVEVTSADEHLQVAAAKNVGPRFVNDKEVGGNRGMNLLDVLKKMTMGLAVNCRVCGQRVAREYDARRNHVLNNHIVKETAPEEMSEELVEVLAAGMKKCFPDCRHFSDYQCSKCYHSVKDRRGHVARYHIDDDDWLKCPFADLMRCQVRHAIPAEMNVHLKKFHAGMSLSETAKAAYTKAKHEMNGKLQATVALCYPMPLPNKRKGFASGGEDRSEGSMSPEWNEDKTLKMQKNNIDKDVARNAEIVELSDDEEQEEMEQKESGNEQPTADQQRGLREESLSVASSPNPRVTSPDPLFSGQDAEAQITSQLGGVKRRASEVRPGPVKKALITDGQNISDQAIKLEVREERELEMLEQERDEHLIILDDDD